jgi:xylulokinase
MVRAVAEGIAHNLGWLLPHVETFTGDHIDEVAFVGGAARSQPWCQILADVIDRPIGALHAPDRAVARATALLALQRHGELTRDDINALVTIDARYEPDAAAHATYAPRQVQFEAAYTALVPISEALT